MNRIVKDGPSARAKIRKSSNGPPIEFAKKLIGLKCMLSIRGELRHGNSEQLTDEVFGIFNDGVTELVLDCRELNYTDTMGMQCLVRIYKHMQKNPGLKFALFVPEGYLLEVLHTCRFDKFINITQDDSVLI